MSRMRFKFLLALSLLIGMAVFPLPKAKGVVAEQEGDPAVLAKMQEINENLRAMGLGIAIEEINFITIGQGRPANRIHQTGLRWVAGDPRRLAQADDITYLVDQSDGAPASGLTNAQTEAALDRAMNTWDASKCLKKVDIVKRADSGADPGYF